MHTAAVKDEPPGAGASPEDEPLGAGVSPEDESLGLGAAPAPGPGGAVPVMEVTCHQIIECTQKPFTIKFAQTDTDRRCVRRIYDIQESSTKRFLRIPHNFCLVLAS